MVLIVGLECCLVVRVFFLLVPPLLQMKRRMNLIAVKIFEIEPTIIESRIRFQNNLLTGQTKEKHLTSVSIFMMFSMLNG